MKQKYFVILMSFVILVFAACIKAKNGRDSLNGAWQFSDSFFYWELYILPDTFYLFNDRVGQVIDVTFAITESSSQQSIIVMRNSVDILRGSFLFEAKNRLKVTNQDTALFLYKIADMSSISNNESLRSFLTIDQFESRKIDFLIKKSLPSSPQH